MDSSRITLLLCGDVMTGRGVDQILRRPSAPRLFEPVLTSALEYVAIAEEVSGPIPRRVGDDYVWGVLPEVLARERPDVQIVNLETSVTTSDEAVPKGINYRMHPDNVGVLRAAAIDCCVLANNHVLDWGRVGLLETLDVLRRAGMQVAGAGRHLAAAREPAVLEVHGKGRVLVFAFGAADSGIPRDWAATGTTSGIDLLPDLSARTAAGVAARIARARRPGDLTVASVHWGQNWGYDVPEAHRQFARLLVDHGGVDVVHGHSSHHPIAIEVHRGRPILYGCGDFLDDYEGIRGQEHFRGDLVLAYLPTLDVRTGELVRLRMVPLQIRAFRLAHPTDADRAWLRDRLGRECARFGHRVTMDDEALALEWDAGRPE